MSVQAVAWVLEHSDTKLAARLVLLSIANHAKADGTGAWPSYETLAQEARISRRHAIAMVELLEAEGKITVQRPAKTDQIRGVTNLYGVTGVVKDSHHPRPDPDRIAGQRRSEHPSPGGSEKSSPGVVRSVARAGEIQRAELVNPSSPEPRTNQTRTARAREAHAALASSTDPEPIRLRDLMDRLGDAMPERLPAETFPAYMVRALAVDQELREASA